VRNYAQVAQCSSNSVSLSVALQTCRHVRSIVEMPRLTRHVCFVPALDLDRAQSFYENVLGLEFLYDAVFARVFRIGDTTLRVTRVDELRPQPFTILGWEVSDIVATLGELAEHSLMPEAYDGMGQDENGVWTAPSGDRVAWIRDSEGNALSLTQKAET
jgi:catechol 2,3-dioxygenase-like lactoylglutathione lyase family enzyme